MITFERQRARERTIQFATQMRGPALAFQFWHDKMNSKDREHLGGGLEKAYREFGLVGMWQKLRGCSQTVAVLDVARKFKMLDTEEMEEILDCLGEVPRDPELRLELAVDAGHLVLRDDEDPTLFFETELLNHKLPTSATYWEFFLKLAKASKSGKSLDAFSIPNRKDGYVRKAASRIRCGMELPSSLTKKIVREGRGRRIDLPPETIRIFESDGRGELREWMPR